MRPTRPPFIEHDETSLERRLAMNDLSRLLGDRRTFTKAFALKRARDHHSPLLDALEDHFSASDLHGKLWTIEEVADALIRGPHHESIVLYQHIETWLIKHSQGWLDDLLAQTVSNMRDAVDDTLAPHIDSVEGFQGALDKLEEELRTIIASQVTDSNRLRVQVDAMQHAVDTAFSKQDSPESSNTGVTPTSSGCMSCLQLSGDIEALRKELDSLKKSIRNLQNPPSKPSLMECADPEPDVYAGPDDDVDVWVPSNGLEENQGDTVPSRSLVGRSLDLGTLNPGYIRQEHDSSSKNATVYPAAFPRVEASLEDEPINATGDSWQTELTRYERGMIGQSYLIVTEKVHAHRT
ncbi:unnamed protein product [Peniophora sp. CBMAI 1063]|nr:unnamed protein product [Peniophora sp. CBMAI 1063]